VSDHKFKFGQMVHYTLGPFGRARPGDVKVIQHLPPEDGEDRWRHGNRVGVAFTSVLLNLTAPPTSYAVLGGSISIVP
jgi:hypothetical protein